MPSSSGASGTVTDNGISVSYEEVSDPEKSPSEQMDGAGLSVTRTIMCKWVDRLTLATELLTRYTVTVGGMEYTYADIYAHAANCMLKRIAGIKPLGIRGVDVDGNLTWDKAILTLEYGPTTFDPGGAVAGSDGNANVVYEETLTLAGEFLTLPNKSLFWDFSPPQSDPIKNSEAPGLLVRMQQWSVNFKALHSIAAPVESLIGLVNDSAITSRTLGITFAPETLLYDGAEIHHQKMITGVDLYDITMKFLRRIKGWNKFYRSGYAEPQSIYTDGGSSAGDEFKPFVPTDLTALYV